ncbi:MAG: TIGR04551 family protein [Myxococcaceae bacterium]|nr:TIGR04551 family protein [Myxococcaceae bacterium]
MARALLAALLALSTVAAAQTAPAGTPPQTTPPAGGPAAPGTPAPAPAEPQPATPAPAPAPTGPTAEEVNEKIEAAKKEMREEIRAQLATQSAAQGWQEEWVEQAQKLELLELDGYLRVRPDLFHKLDLGRVPDPDGYTLFPRPPTSPNERTIAGVNMRARIEPTINISEEVRVKMQIDALDNVVFGSTPIYLNTRSELYQFAIDSNTQLPPQAGLNSFKDSILVKRAYGEVSTPVGILRFGRMGSHWGLGMLHNDGNCIDCDFGDTVDRIQFVMEPFTGWYAAGMLDFNVEGPTSEILDEQGQPFDLSNSDDTHSYVIAIARRDTEQQERAKLDNNLGVLNYGIHFTYRTNRNDPIGWANGQPSGWVKRSASLYIPDVWAKYERKEWRVEIEGAAVIGNIDNRATSVAAVADPGQTQALNILEFGAAAQGEYRFLDGQLRLQLDLGFASGDKAPGLGNRPRRVTGGSNGNTQPGDIDGRQYVCASNGSCSDNYIRNFRFNRDYRIDMILWREILGPITDAFYAKPTLTYSVAEGFDIFGAIIGSAAVYPESTPSGTDRLLGIEINAGARYLTEDGFFAQVQWGILFPQGGLANPSPGNGAAAPDLETAQAIRGILGIKY